MKDIIEIVNHCDECDLGYCSYQCPVCNKSQIDFDLWWEIHPMMDNPYKIHNTVCEDCYIGLYAWFDSSKGLFYISDKKDN